MNKYTLYTTDNCNICERVKNLIKNQKLGIEIKKATEEEIKRFRKQKVLSFPVLTDYNFNIISFGAKAGYYIAENIEKLKHLVWKKHKIWYNIGGKFERRIQRINWKRQGSTIYFRGHIKTKKNRERMWNEALLEKWETV